MPPRSVGAGLCEAEFRCSSARLCHSHAPRRAAHKLAVEVYTRAPTYFAETLFGIAFDPWLEQRPASVHACPTLSNVVACLTPPVSTSSRTSVSLRPHQPVQNSPIKTCTGATDGIRLHVYLSRGATTNPKGLLQPEDFISSVMYASSALQESPSLLASMDLNRPTALEDAARWRKVRSHPHLPDTTHTNH